MNKDYIEVCLEHNRFAVNCEFLLGDDLYEADAIIDTGCQLTLLPFRALGITDNNRLDYKRRAILGYRDGKIGVTYSKGVESGDIELPPVKTLTDKELLESPHICFIHKVRNMMVNGCDIGAHTVKVSYDRHCRFLLGMNILKTLMFHVDSNSGSTIFLGVPKQQTNKSAYYTRLKELFSLEPCGRQYARDIRGGVLCY